MARTSIKIKNSNFTDSSKKSLKQSFVEEIVKDRVKEYCKENKKQLYPISQEAKKKIMDCYENMMKPALKAETELYEKEISGVYAPSFGYGNIQRKYKIKEEETAESAIQIYNAINKISALIRGEDEVNYRIYVRVIDPDTGQVEYFSKQVQADQIVKTYAYDKKNMQLIGDGSKVLNEIFPNLKDDLKKNEAQENFYNHLYKFIDIIENHIEKKNNEQKLKEEGVQNKKEQEEKINLGFAYEAYEWHLNHYGEVPKYDNKNGSIASFTPGHERFYSPGIIRGYYKTIGNAKFSTGGDVYQTQLKSIQVSRQKRKKDQFSVTSSFSVSSLGQLERTISLIIQNLVKQDSLTEQNITDLVLAFNDLQREAASTSYNKIIAVVDKRIKDAIKSLTI